MNEKEAKEIMGQNFIGSEELSTIQMQLHISDPSDFGTVPAILFDSKLLKAIHEEYLLILGIPYDQDKEKLTINRMRSLYGWNPEEAEPCFYNQDWYLKEQFASDTTLDLKWYLIQKSLNEETRGQAPEDIRKKLGEKEQFPPAILTAFAFFAYYFLTEGKEILWKHDFIWCSDADSNGDRIYTGRYEDSNHINKNGFNVHRHLSLKPSYGSAVQIHP